MIPVEMENQTKVYIGKTKRLLTKIIYEHQKSWTSYYGNIALNFFLKKNTKTKLLWDK